MCINSSTVSHVIRSRPPQVTLKTKSRSSGIAEKLVSINAGQCMLVTDIYPQQNQKTLMGEKIKERKFTQGILEYPQKYLYVQL